MSFLLEFIYSFGECVDSWVLEVYRFSAVFTFADSIIHCAPWWERKVENHSAFCAPTLWLSVEWGHAHSVKKRRYCKWSHYCTVTHFSSDVFINVFWIHCGSQMVTLGGGGVPVNFPGDRESKF